VHESLESNIRARICRDVRFLKKIGLFLSHFSCFSFVIIYLGTFPNLFEKKKKLNIMQVFVYFYNKILKNTIFEQNLKNREETNNAKREITNFEMATLLGVIN
jgi:hypothetical protein